jgi:sugar phosphate isomerase/epimerase
LHIHLDDNRGDFDSHLVPGRGSIDFAALFRALSESGYDGFASVELGPVYNLEPGSACRDSREALMSIMAQYA